jgi:uncharacterized Zn finger protein
MAVATIATPITFEHIAATISDITPEQIGAAHKVIAPNGKSFYKVESSKDATVEYTVTKSKKFGFQCTCKSGQHGWWNVTHASGVCWHVRAAVACYLEEKQAMIEQERLNAVMTVLHIEYTSVDVETLERVAARDAKRQPAKAYPPMRRQGFSLLKRA